MLQEYRPGQRAGESPDDGDELVTVLDDADELVAALDDADCRAFLRALDEPRTAAGLCQCCDVPSSTAYRKLDRLVDVGLVDSKVKVRSDGNHRKQFSRTVDAVTITVDDDARLERE
ncbi:winged helix-turn-helix domain-containing protein [Halocalculus aciditolerans]|uniref:Helix-turn-helix domain-containing protein n=1 Tax=Halocalculus aciditolerans TaxID=1383812 RepID=A0A830FMD7_9EURY|nr:helix-turn-helix domain-containing protein [Halocalculus aciditolerans]GGL66939.1 hypothetical protein GCM10009039_26160 [Halocalculus aciditolerans]